MRLDDLWKANWRDGRSEKCPGRCVFASTVGAIELTKEVRLRAWHSLCSRYGSCNVPDVSAHGGVY